VTSLAVSTMTTQLFKANGIEGSIHRCRHTYATQLLRAGVNIRVVQTLMRHASLTSTQIYTAVDEDERRDAINRLVAA
jgi:integrase/recombinase XerD